MHQVLARKWRPRTFDELVGQPAVVRALTNAIRQNRLHHAYLLTGTRGVGKTTLGRILARCLNCETGPTADPCGRCSACVEIAEGRHVDLIEVDAASRTKVDDTRELLENAQYAPVSGRFKIYLIDEVHMLSEKSFNALLKTLEEPPEHVKFILATTDPQKLPITVVSRCLQFSLQPMPVATIADHLAKVLAAEEIDADAAALERIGAAAQGSMRDALSLTEQAIAFAAGRLTDTLVCDMLGLLPQAVVQQLLDALFSGDAPALLETLAQLRRQAPDWARLLGDAADLCYQVALVQFGTRDATLPAHGGDDDILPTRSGPARDWLQAVAATADPVRVQLTYQILILGGRDLEFAPSAEVGAEMTFLRAAGFWPSRALPSSGAAPPESPPLATPQSPSTPAGTPAARTGVGTAAAPAGSADSAAPPPATGPSEASRPSVSTAVVARRSDSADRRDASPYWSSEAPSSDLASEASSLVESRSVPKHPASAPLHSGEGQAPGASLGPQAAIGSDLEPTPGVPASAEPEPEPPEAQGRATNAEKPAESNESDPPRRDPTTPRSRSEPRSTATPPDDEATADTLAKLEVRRREGSRNSGDDAGSMGVAAQPASPCDASPSDAGPRAAGPPAEAVRDDHLGAPLDAVAEAPIAARPQRTLATDRPASATAQVAASPPPAGSAAASAERVATESVTSHVDRFDWAAWVGTLEAGPLRELAANAIGEWTPPAESSAAGVLRLRLAPIASTLAGATRLARLRNALLPILGDDFELESIDDPDVATHTPNAVRAAEREARRERIEVAVHGHPLVLALQQRLGARVVRINDPDAQETCPGLNARAGLPCSGPDSG